MALLVQEMRASYAFVERNFLLTRRYWVWDLAFLVNSVVTRGASCRKRFEPGEDRR